MGDFRISCQSQDMIFWDEMPHSLGAYVWEEPVSFIFCWEGGGSEFLQNVNNYIKWFNCWDFGDTLQQKSKWCNQHIITQLIELLRVFYKYYDWHLWYTWLCELHFCISGSFQMWMYCCDWDMETGNLCEYKHQNLCSDVCIHISSNPIEVYYAWFQASTAK